jgi:hypothetical protein
MGPTGPAISSNSVYAGEAWRTQRVRANMRAFTRATSRAAAATRARTHTRSIRLHVTILSPLFMPMSSHSVRALRRRPVRRPEKHDQ